MEQLLKQRMVRHERSRLQKEHEIHIRKYPVEENTELACRKTFLNTLHQSRLLEACQYSEGARKWSLSLPWLLSFSTDRGKTTKCDGNASSFYAMLNPQKGVTEELFAYNEKGVKACIKTLPEQNIAFYQICKENVRGRMRQLLWVPATVPLYSPGNQSIFAEYKDYSKLLIFAEYRYLQRGGARLLSDFVTYENKRNLVEEIPENFPQKTEWYKAVEELSRADVLSVDYRHFDVDDVIEDVKEKYSWETGKALAAIASPAICAYRLKLDAEKVEAAFYKYISGSGKREALWNWLSENGYREEARWEEGILRYCAEGNFYAVLEEWLFVLKEEEGKTPTEQICERLEYQGSTVHVQTLSTTLAAVQASMEKEKCGQETEKEKKEREQKTHGKAGGCAFAEQLTGDVNDNGAGENEKEEKRTANTFSSPLWPMILFAGRGAQEGIDFHEYCLRIMHLTLPRGAVSYEQRNGRIDRFRSLLVRRRVVEYFEMYGTNAEIAGMTGLMKRMFAAAVLQKKELKQEQNYIFPNWHFHVGKSRWNFEELIPMWNYSREHEEMIAYDEMLRSYRGSMGLNSTMGTDDGINLSSI